MGWVIVLEENQEFLKQIGEALTQVDPQNVVVSFSDSKEFMHWVNLITKKDKKALDKIPRSQFRGVISAVESWNFRDIKLIEKFRALFIQIGISNPDDETCVVLTGYDTPQLNKHRYEQRSINNFIYKPFDQLLLKQMLEIALTGRHPVAKYHIYNFKTDVRIEMLKEIRVSEITEVGFQTVSDQKVEPGKIAKYYADFLKTNQHRSAIGRALSSSEIPGSQMVRMNMGFFALDQQQSFNLQRMIQTHKQTRPLSLPKSDDTNHEIVFFKHEKQNLCSQIQESIERFFKAPTTTVESIAEFGQHFKNVKADASKAATKHLIFVDGLHVLGNEIAELDSISKLAEGADIALYLLSSNILKEALEFELTTKCEDIFYAPFNRSYIIKTMKQHYPSLGLKEDLFESHADHDQLIHVSNPVTVIEVSEAGLVMEYYRPLSIGSFREFVFWMPNEVEVPSLLGQCNFSEQAQGKKTFNCHFIFFGMHDAQLKHLRKWILHNYIEGKSEDS